MSNFIFNKYVKVRKQTEMLWQKKTSQLRKEDVFEYRASICAW
jgi:hypothetical protein